MDLSNDDPFAAVEPPAHMRNFARMCRDLYVSLRKESFNEHQALIIVGQVVAAAVAANQGKDDDDES